MKYTRQEILEELDSLKEVVQILHRRRRALEKQLATEGIQVRPQVPVEIDAINIKIKDCEQEIERLENFIDNGKTLAMSESRIPLPFELQLDFLQRRTTLTEGQLRILVFIENAGYNREYIHQEIIENNFKQYSHTEIYYRLDNLRLLGFIEKERSSPDSNGDIKFLYRLSEPYQTKFVNYRAPHSYSVRENIQVKPNTSSSKKKK